MLKQILALMLSLTLVFCFVACGSQSEPQNIDSAPIFSIDTSFEVGEVTESFSENSTVSAESERPQSTLESETKPVSSIPVASASFSEISSVITSVSSSSSSDVVLNLPPPDDFNGDSVEELIAWLRSNQQFTTSIAGTQEPNITINSTGSNIAQRVLVVPQVVNEDLSNYGITVPEDSDTYVYDFRTYESEVINENQLYTISVKPLTTEDMQKDLTDLYYPEKEILKGIYKGVEYAYKDGYEGTNKTDRFYASAWFVKDGYVIKIAAFWANAFKPWNTAWFDYFEFETITL